MYAQITSLLTELEHQLKVSKLWQYEPIDPNLLSSSQPFCIDTLHFEQWLQYVFIVKMRQLIKLQQPLPTQIALTPMAQVAFKDSHTSVKETLLAIDVLLGDANDRP